MLTNCFFNQYPNIPAYFALGNRHFVTNFGSLTLGDSVQHNIYPTGYPSLTYALAQGIGNPNHISQYNPMLLGLDLTSNLTTNPALLNMSAASAYQNGYRVAALAGLQGSFNALGGLKAQIEQILKSEHLTGLQKQKLQAVVKKLTVMEEKIKSALQKRDLDINKIDSLQKELKTVIEDASKVAGDIVKELKDQAADPNKKADGNKSDATDDDDSDDGAGSADPIEDMDAADYSNLTNEEIDKVTEDADEKINNAKEEANKNFKKEQDEKLTEATKLCSSIADAVFGCGTNDKALMTASKKINKDNVLSVLNAWQTSYIENTGDANLFETLFDEEPGWNENLSEKVQNGTPIQDPENITDMLWNIVVALDEKAQEYGIKTEMVGQFETVYRELKSTWKNETKIKNAIYGSGTGILAKLTAKEKEKNTELKEEAEEKAVKDVKKDIQNDVKNENDAKATKAKETFKKDLRDIYGDEKAEISENVKYENGTFKIRIKGKEYYGKDFNELSKALEDAGLEPKNYLVKPAKAADIKA